MKLTIQCSLFALIFLLSSPSSDIFDVILNKNFKTAVSAASNDTINFQGKIVRNGTGVSGLNVTNTDTSCVVGGADTCDFSVEYYTASSGGTALWHEEFIDREIGDYDGVFNLSLGTGTNTSGTESSFENVFINNTTVYVEVKFAPAGASSFTQTFTRMHVRAAPYAINSKYLNGIPDTGFVKLAPSSVQTDSTTNNSIYINKTGGSGNILQLQKSGTDRLTLDNSGNLALGDSTPDALLDVNGLSIFGNQLASNSSGREVMLINELVNVDDDFESVINTTGQTMYGLHNQFTLDPSATAVIDGFDFYGGMFDAEIFEGNTRDFTSGGNDLVAIQGQADYKGYTAITNVYGVVGAGSNRSTNASAGDVTNAYGGSFISQNWGPGTITNAIAIETEIRNTGAGTITNAVGLLVDNIDEATNNSLIILGQATIPTGNYGIYNSSNAPSVFTGTFNSGSDLSISGTGTRMIWHPKKAAFRAGRVLAGNSMDDANIGDHSAAFGIDNTASGDESFAIGGGNTASGDEAFVAGSENSATAWGSVVFGNQSTASGTHSTIFGVNSTTSANYSFGTGIGLSIASYNSFTIGRYNVGGGTPGSWVATESLFEIGNGTAPGSRANALTVLKNGQVGIGEATPTALLHIDPATTGRSQFRLETSAGTNPSSPNSGDLWWNGTQLYFYNGSTSLNILNGATTPSLASVLTAGNTSGGTAIDMQNALITNIGNAGTDFTSGGGLTLADVIAISGTGLSYTLGDWSVGASSLTAPFSVDESANTIRFGETGTNVTTNWYDSAGGTGSIVYSSDTWLMNGGDLQFNSAAATTSNFIISGDTNANLLYSDADNNRILIGTNDTSGWATVNLPAAVVYRNRTTSSGSTEAGFDVRMDTTHASGQVVTAIAQNLQLNDSSASGTVADGRALQIGVSGTSIANAYGLYVDTITGTTDSYGIYVNGGNKNFVAGTLGVGISTSQTAKLHVLAATSAGELVTFTDNYNGISQFLVQNSNTGTSADSRFLSQSTDGDYIAFSQPGANNNLTMFGLTRNTASLIFTNHASNANARHLALGTFRADDVIIGTNNLERMRIDSSGNVGIGGTASANALLHVGKDSGAAGTISLYIENKHSTGSSLDEYAALEFLHNGGGAARIVSGKEEDFTSAANRTGYLSFETRKDGAYSEQMRINSRGELMLGTTALTEVHTAFNTLNNTIIEIQGNGTDNANDEFASLILSRSRSAVSGDHAVGTISFANTALTGEKRLGQISVIASSDTDTGDMYLSTTANGVMSHSIIMTGLGGDVGIGGITPTYRLDVADNTTTYAANIFNDGNANTRLGLQIQTGSDTGSGVNTLIQFRDGDGTDVGEITFTSTTTSYSNSSDRRLKSNIVETQYSIDDLMAIQVRDYTFITNNNETVHTGFIAQDLYEVYPEAVTVGGEDPLTDSWKIDYGKLTPIIVQAIQDQQVMIEAMQLEIDALGGVGESVNNLTVLNTLSGNIINANSITSTSTTTNSLIAQNVTIQSLLQAETAQLRVLSAYNGENLTLKLGDSDGNNSLNVTNSNNESVFGVTSTGKVKIKSTGSDASVGTSTIEVGHTTVEVYTTALTADSKIFITPKTTASGVVPSVALVEIIEDGVNTRFIVKSSALAAEEIQFDWWVIN